MLTTQCTPPPNDNFLSDSRKHRRDGGVATIFLITQQLLEKCPWAYLTHLNI